MKYPDKQTKKTRKKSARDDVFLKYSNTLRMKHAASGQNIEEVLRLFLTFTVYPSPFFW